MVLVVLGILFGLFALLVAVEVATILSLVIPVATLALLLTPVVRQHCAKSLAPALR